MLYVGFVVLVTIGLAAIFQTPLPFETQLAIYAPLQLFHLWMVLHWIRHARTQRLWRLIAADQRAGQRSPELYAKAMKRFGVPMDPRVPVFEDRFVTLFKSYWQYNAKLDKRDDVLMRDQDLLWGYRYVAAQHAVDGFNPFDRAITVAFGSARLSIYQDTSGRYISDQFAESRERASAGYEVESPYQSLDDMKDRFRGVRTDRPHLRVA